MAFAAQALLDQSTLYTLKMTWLFRVVTHVMQCQPVRQSVLCKGQEIENLWFYCITSRH